MPLFGRHEVDELRGAAAIDLGYFGNGEACYPVHVLAGLPLGGCFAEPAEDDEVFTAGEIFRRGPTPR